MRRLFFPGLTALLLCLSTSLFANNISVSGATLTGQNPGTQTASVRFTVSWDNSWRVAGSPSNWDGAWVFVKYRLPGGPWQHASLAGSGHVAPAGSVIETGLRNPSSAYDAAANPAVGAFIYRSAAGAGTFTATNVQLVWNYGADGVTNAAQVDVQVFAIEMVYVPQASFQLGSGLSSGTTSTTEADPFYTYPSTSTPFAISSEAAITVGTTAGNLYYDNAVTTSGDNAGPIPATFPKGYKSFWAMKHEISQQAYVDFLNTLTRSQQAARVGADISGTSVTNRYVLSNSSTLLGRNGIRCNASVGTGPISFYCDLDGDGIGGESNDGLGVACNYLGWADLAAYFDWACLRPMTELEFEKLARGTATPVPGEYVWGTANLAFGSGQVNSGLPTETFTASTPSYLNISSSEPWRVGLFAQSGNNRETSGAGFYGALDLGGNVAETVVTIGDPAGRTFTGLPGDGSLAANGDANVANWPGATAAGTGQRGGSCFTSAGFTLWPRTSDRRFASDATKILSRAYFTGGRGVR